MAGGCPLWQGVVVEGGGWGGASGLTHVSRVTHHQMDEGVKRTHTDILTFMLH